MKLRVTSTALNAGVAARRCIESVQRQSFGGWTHHFFDAASTDDTYAQATASPDARTCVVGKKDRLEAFDNLLPLWRSFADDDVIVWLDGDDWLAVDGALAMVNWAHEQGAHVTYGQFVWPDGHVGFAQKVGPDPRTEPWHATHLKTFRAGLVNRILEEDLRRSSGEWFLPRDQPVMLPLLEMAPANATFIPRVLYAYNYAHSHEANEDQGQVHADVYEIRARPRYKRVV